MNLLVGNVRNFIFYKSYFESDVEYTSDAQFNAHQKRLKGVDFSHTEYEKQKEEKKEEFYPGANKVNFGEVQTPKPEKVDKMVEELEKV
jgi:hypothetical protein